MQKPSLEEIAIHILIDTGFTKPYDEDYYNLAIDIAKDTPDVTLEGYDMYARKLNRKKFVLAFS